MWDDCKHFINNPGQALADAQRQLRERLAQSTDQEERRRALLRELAEKETERERVLTLYRRGRITLDEADGQLDAVGRETAALRGLLDSLRAQDALTEAAEAQLADTATMLAQLQGRLRDIEASGDATAKRAVIDLLVSGITVQTEGEGRSKKANVTIRYTFAEPKRGVVVSGTQSGG